MLCYRCENSNGENTRSAQQFAVVEKELSQYFGKREDILPMMDWGEAGFLEMVAKADYLFVVTGGAGKRPQGKYT